MQLDSSPLGSQSLVQGSQEWLEWRKTHVGASDQTHLQWSAPWSIGWKALWDIKMSLAPEQTQTKHMARGVDLEKDALIAYSLLKNSEFRPAIVESEEYPYISASLDAVNDRGEVAEIKCPGAEDHALAVDGKIPPKYIPQLCHQLYVTQAPTIDYVSYDGTNISIVSYKRDEELIARVIGSAHAFHAFLKLETEPTGEYPLPEFDTRIPITTDPKLMELAVDNIALREMIASLERSLEINQEKILILCDSPRIKIGNLLQIVTTARSGTIQYAKIPGLKDIDLEPFRTAPTLSRSIRRISSK